MKRILIACDGTWNRLDATYPTNVLKFAQSVVSTAADGTKQIVIYVEGVGTGHGTGKLARFIDKVGGGAFGSGLMANIERAYEQLVFTYEPGDEIHIVGFSRGAYTARSLAGLIRSSGIISRDHVDKISEAIDRYQSRAEDSHPDVPDNCRFRAAYSPSTITSQKDHEWRERNHPDLLKRSTLLKIAYLGVWDTVGALGVPNHYAIASLFNQKFQFHDTDLSRSVAAARHAVAIDEHRATFPPALWGNLEDLNSLVGSIKYRQEWFPGDHGSVGGGGDIYGLSANSFLWIVEGAQKQGLELDDTVLTATLAKVSYKAPLCNQTKPDGGFFAYLMSMKLINRKGPDLFSELSSAAKLRWRENEINLPGAKNYRPKPLEALERDLRLWEQDTKSEYGEMENRKIS